MKIKFLSWYTISFMSENHLDTELFMVDFQAWYSFLQCNGEGFTEACKSYIESYHTRHNIYKISMSFYLTYQIKDNNKIKTSLIISKGNDN